MFAVDFKGYATQHPQWQEENKIYIRDDDIYRRLKFSAQKDEKNVEYFFTVNVKTGEVYNTDCKRIIFFKHLILTIGRPVYTVIKTFYHASIIAPLAYEVFKYVKKKQSASDLGMNMYRSCADIVRTPLYGLAMTITHIAALILGVISPNTLYKTREIIGKLERELMWGLKPFSHHILEIPMGYLSPCFSPIKNVACPDLTKTLSSHTEMFTPDPYVKIEDNRRGVSNRANQLVKV